MPIPASTRTQLGAVADGDLRNEVFDTAFESQFSRALKMLGGVNRLYEAQMQNSNSLRVYTDLTALTVRDVDLPNAGNTAVHQWRTAGRNSMSVSAKRLIWDRELTTDLDIPAQDVAEIPVNLLVQGADDVATRVAGAVDAYIESQWRAVDLSAVPQGVDPATGAVIANLAQTADLGTASGNSGLIPVSYTHLTLPTIYSV